MTDAELLNCRAGKLLRKGKRFVVVAVDEPYFTAVFMCIRAWEMAQGRWTDEDEQWYGEAVHESQGLVEAASPFEHGEIARIIAWYTADPAELETVTKQRDGLLDACRACWDYWVACAKSSEGYEDKHAACHLACDTVRLANLADIAARMTCAAIAEADSTSPEGSRT